MFRRGIIAAALTAALLLGAPNAGAVAAIKETVAAGPLYPLELQTLRRTLHRLFSQVSPPNPGIRHIASIVPHDGYGLSGEIAAQAFDNLLPGQYDRVVVLAPAHFTTFEDCSIPLVEAYVTPLGFVELDDEAIQQLMLSPLINARALHYDNRNEDRVPLHEEEYTIEIVLPFLQEKLGQFKLVPLRIGTFVDASGKYDENRAKAIAEAIQRIITPRTLLIVSTDFTHYGNDFSFRPFGDDAAARIEALDREAFRLVQSRDTKGFDAFLEQTGVVICGANPLRVLMHVLPKQARPQLLGYTTSAKKTGAANRSVSYAAINFYDPEKPPLPPNGSVPQLPPFDPNAPAKQPAPTPAPEEDAVED